MATEYQICFLLLQFVSVILFQTTVFFVQIDCVMGCYSQPLKLRRTCKLQRRHQHFERSYWVSYLSLSCYRYWNGLLAIHQGRGAKTPPNRTTTSISSLINSFRSIPQFTTRKELLFIHRKPFREVPVLSTRELEFPFLPPSWNLHSARKKLFCLTVLATFGTSITTYWRRRLVIGVITLRLCIGATLSSPLLQKVKPPTRKF